MAKLDQQVIRKLTTGAVQRGLRPPPSLSELFHENTKLTPTGLRELGRLFEHVARSPVIRALQSQPHKVFSLMDAVALPDAVPTGELEQTIRARRSVRRYSGEPVSREELARLLYFSYGETDSRTHCRAVSSGGAVYPLDIYALVMRCEGLDAGVYHYDAEHHRLDVLGRREFGPELHKAAFLSDVEADTLAVLFVITATFVRSTIKRIRRNT